LSTRELPTPVGSARLHLEGAGRLLVLGHGAGGGVSAPDLLAARAAGLDAGLCVVRVEQPWRVRGRRVAEVAPRLDAAWLAVLAHLAPEHGRPLVVGGRSSGARVACRTATATGAAGVLCLAFPLHPPGRPGTDRGAELAIPGVPRLVVQGERDPFGVPAAGRGVAVQVVRGADHAFAVRRTDGRSAGEVRAEVQAVVAAWLSDLVASGPAQRLT